MTGLVAKAVTTGLLVLAVVLASTSAPVARAQPLPPPPPGPSADSPTLPPLPAGPTASATPDKQDGQSDDQKPTALGLGQLGLSGFWEIRGGLRTQRDSHSKDASIGETRLHLAWEQPWQQLTFNVAADFVYDPVLDHHTVNLETGQGWIDLRQANVAVSPAKFMDLKIGRQILTWGTGDLLFINDLFPKDWQAFFTGRDQDYLKAPSDAVKISLFSDLANADLVWTPRFDADRFIRGRRLSYYNTMLGRRAGRDAVVDVDRPDEWFDDSEWALRVHRNVAGYELAAYGYWGYWKSPGGSDPRTGKATFPRLSVYGASGRGQIGKGIGNVEAAWYDSRQDRAGSDPLVKNSQFRFLLGYEQDLPQVARDLTVGCQYYLEWMADYDDYLAALPAGVHAADERRHVLTFRVTKMLMNQNLILSLFAYYSPSDSDAFLRPKLTYKIDDNWTCEFGGNVFIGKDPHTFFGQFADNSNVYASLRYAF